MAARSPAESTRARAEGALLGGSPAARRAAALAVSAVLAFFALYRLDAYELTKLDESRSGVIVRSMVESGQWLLPRTPDGYLTEKPIVYYGLCALLSRWFGVGETSLRGVSAAMAIGATGIVWWLTRIYGSGTAAWIAAIAFASNLLVLKSGRSATVDMTLAFFISAGLTAVLAARQHRLRPWPAALLAGVCFGLATLTKGPIGTVLPAAVLSLLWLGDMLAKRARSARTWLQSVPWGPALLGAGIAAAIALAWYVPAYLRGGREFLETSVLSENFYMPIGEPRGLGVGHPKSWSFYPAQQLFALAAMAPLLPLTLRWLRERGSTRARLDLATWFGAGFLLFAIAGNKRAHYLVPLQPAAAAMIGLAASAWLEREPPRLLRWSSALFGVGLLLASAFGLWIGLHPASLPEDASEPTRQMIDHGAAYLIAFSALSACASAYLIAASRGATRQMVRAAACLGCLWLAARSAGYEPVLGRLDYTRPFVAEMLDRIPPGTQLAALTPPPGYGLDFYWPTRLIRDPEQAERAPWVLVSLKQLPALRGAFDVIGVWRSPDHLQDVGLIHRRDP